MSLCCIVSFYYNDLYDFRKVRSFVEFASRLLQSFGLALILLSAFYILSPETSIDGRLIVWTFLIIVGLLLPLRAVWYGLMRSRRLAARVLILGTSSLAHYIIREIESHLYFRYAIVGMADNTMASAEPGFGVPLLGPLDHLDKIIEEVQPDRIVTALAERRGRLPVHQLLRVPGTWGRS